MQQWQQLTTAQSSAARAIHNPEVNPTLRQARDSHNWAHWENAIEEELAMLKSNAVFDIVHSSDIGPTHQILPTSWVLKRKRDGRFKARLVVNGNRERCNYDMFSPTVSEFTLRFVIALAINLHMPLRGYDVFGAFCIPSQTREVYVRVDKELWRLRKTLYGLSDSPRRFYEHLRDTLLTGGYSQCSNDQCLFFKRGPCKEDLLLAVIHVDDFAVAASSDAMHDELMAVLEATYVLTKFPLLEDFLGVQLVHNADGSISLNNFKYLSKLVNDYAPPGSDNSHRLTSPMSSKFNDAEQDDSPPTPVDEYRALLGKLLFMARTRHDIAFAVNRLAARANKATVLDKGALIRVVRYLGTTPDICITYYPSSNVRAASTFTFYVDCATVVYGDGKGQTGFCGRLGDDPRTGMFIAKSCKQKVVATGSCHCETIGAVEAIKTAVWMRALTEEIGLDQNAPTVIFCDNAAMIQLFQQFSGNHKHVRHFMTLISYAMDQVRLGTCVFKFLAGPLHPADSLSKPKAGQPQRDDVRRIQGAPFSA
jgi:hypothetical protein